ncbi:serpin B [Umezawaea tangerina]|uniref:Serpin B n=1 Tax=Umezawaea tangerina TaxID=84725 RepID=A0A2T0SRR5_9PSEU|nr:serpin B [Umezawaea tangerina]
MSDHLAFTLALHDVVAADRRRNACWSPYSVASALGLAALAARGKTRDELVALVGEDNQALLDEGRPDDEAAFAVANTLWASDELETNPGFADALAAWPGAKTRSAPFGADPDGARKLINADVAETTNDLIPDLLAPGSVGPDTVAALVNALYLKTAWLGTFPEEATAALPFAAPGGAVDVPTMRREAKFRYAARDGWQAVSLPARGGVEALVLLPDGDLGPLDEATFAALTGALDFRQLELFLPKLDVSVNLTLKSALTGLGVRSLFERDGDLTGLSADPRLFVDEVVHEAVLRIDEDGLEGAAATAVMMRMTSFEGYVEPLTVRVDRPHLLFVRHAGTGAVYFLAQVVDPS